MNAPGIVSTHAHITRLATPHRTALSRWVVPTPTIAPLIVCVVDTGTPPKVARPNEIAADVSQATWKIDRLMRDDIQWHALSQRCQSFYRETHSVEAIIDKYEREILALTGRG